MTSKDITLKLHQEFSSSEQLKLAQKPVTTIQNMARSDRIIIENELLDYLRDFFNGIYDGEPIPKVFGNALIEFKDAMNNLFRLYVTFPEEKEDWVYIDVFFEWRFLGKMLFPNVKKEDSDRLENGHFNMITPFLCVNSILPQKELAVLADIAKDVFMYAYLYVQANKDVKAIYKEDVIPGANSGKTSKKSGSKGKQKKEQQKREKVYIPTRRVYTLKKSEETERRLCEYIYSRWKVRGYSYTRKDGRVINVKEHYKFRHLPNKGIDKDGKDFILRKKDVEE